MDPDLDMLRKRAEHAYAHWRDAGCDSLTPQAAAADEHCARLKAELDTAEGTVRLVTEGTRPVGSIG